MRQLLAIAELAGVLEHREAMDQAVVRHVGSAKTSHYLAIKESDRLVLLSALLRPCLPHMVRANAHRLEAVPSPLCNGLAPKRQDILRWDRLLDAMMGSPSGPPPNLWCGYPPHATVPEPSA